MRKGARRRPTSVRSRPLHMGASTGAATVLHVLSPLLLLSSAANVAEGHAFTSSFTPSLLPAFGCDCIRTQERCSSFLSPTVVSSTPSTREERSSSSTSLVMRIAKGKAKSSQWKGNTIATTNIERMRSAGRRGTKRFVDPNKLFVGNLPYDVTTDDLRRWFDEQGVGVHVLSCKVITDWKTKESKGYGFAQFTTPIYATSALELIKGRKIKGRVVRLNQGQKKQPDPVVIIKEKGAPVIEDEEDAVIASAIDATTDEEAVSEEEQEEEENVAAELSLELDHPDGDTIVDSTFEDFDDNDLYVDDEDFQYDGVYEEEYQDELEETTDVPLNREQRREAAKKNKKRRKPGKGFGI